MSSEGKTQREKYRNEHKEEHKLYRKYILSNEQRTRA